MDECQCWRSKKRLKRSVHALIRISFSCRDFWLVMQGEAEHTNEKGSFNVTAMFWYNVKHQLLLNKMQLFL